jgi:ADP-ribose pyrophosphatase YjhB (NUDIX family)
MPVCVVLQPVLHGGREGLLVVRRAEQPRVGWLTLPGGFLEDHELWQEGSAREVLEESGAIILPATLTPFWFTSTTPRPNRVLLFSVGTPLASLPPFQPTNETSERGLIFGPDGLDPLFAFELHVEAIRRYFTQRGVVGPHAYLEA